MNILAAIIYDSISPVQNLKLTPIQNLKLAILSQESLIDLACESCAIALVPSLAWIFGFLPDVYNGINNLSACYVEAGATYCLRERDIRERGWDTRFNRQVGTPTDGRRCMDAFSVIATDAADVFTIQNGTNNDNIKFWFIIVLWFCGFVISVMSYLQLRSLGPRPPTRGPLIGIVKRSGHVMI